MLETPRLTLIPLTLDHLRLYIADNYRLEQAIGIKKGYRTPVEPTRSIVTHFTIPRLQDPTLDPLYHTMWLAIDREKQQFVAEAKFKGEPDETGSIEIGYGTYPTLRRQGYMTEMVGALVSWAKQQPQVERIVADTEAQNIASQKVLKKNGFSLFGRVEDILWWEYIME
jgi:ribosomal-protein-alanine N-acetyltransferase